MSPRLESLLDPERVAQCKANDALLERHGTPTVRRHPRSLSEAFPDVRARAIEPHVPPPLLRRFTLFIRRRFA